MPGVCGVKPMSRSERNEFRCLQTRINETKC